MKTMIKAIALGGFDGMHIAHQHLFEALGEQGAIVVIETGYADMTPGKVREEHTHYPVFYYELSSIKGLSGEAFVQKMLDEFPQLEKIVVGFDFHFGQGRSCSSVELKSLFLEQKPQGEVRVIDEVMFHEKAVHSHKIRQYLESGDLALANAFLGYHYKMHGKIIAGQGVGKNKLVPTINLEISGYRIPKEGVYATFTRLDDDHLYPSVSFIGKRHITDGSFAIESHILDVTPTVSEHASISFVHYIRENKAFDSFEALKQQIEMDIQEAKKHLQHLAL